MWNNVVMLLDPISFTLELTLFPWRVPPVTD